MSIPNIFRDYINITLRLLLDEFVIVYIDNTYLSSTQGAHKEHLRIMIGFLRKNNVRALVGEDVNFGLCHINSMNIVDLIKIDIIL